MNTIVYLIEANLFLVLFYGFYLLFLRKETFNNLNRGYLVIAGLTAFAVPFLQSEMVRSWFVTKQVNDVIYTVYSPEILITALPVETPVLWADILRILYISVVVFLSVKLVLNVIMTTQLFSNFSQNVGEAFSFFGKINVDEDLEGRDTIYRHEEVHSKHFHSADVLLFELIGIVCWFNPVVYFYKRAVRNIHEFIADELASRNLACKADYATLLLSRQFNISTSVLTNTFYKPSTIKLRIEMLLKKRSKRTALTKYGLIAPLFLVMMVFASATVLDKNGLEEIAESVEIPLTELPSIQDISVLSPISTIGAESIEGTVVDINGQPIRGASVVLKAAGIGTKTDDRGRFYITMDAKEVTLVISSEGLNSKEVSCEAGDDVKVTLIEQSNELKEVVVMAPMPNAIQRSPSYNDNIFTTVEQQPEFPGGVSAMYQHIGRNINYPNNARRKGVEGKVFVKFIVRSNGNVGDITILKGIGGGCDEEAVRVVAQMPKWSPGMQDGKPVNVYFTMPIKFALEKNDSVNDDIVAKPIISFKSTDDATTKIRLQGFSEVTGEKPLVVLDGKVMPSYQLNNLNPQDISAIDVLKGANATDKYGNRAKDGVIIITTKAAVNGFGKIGKNENRSSAYTHVDDQPEFPGGVVKMYNYIGQNISYPKAAQRANIKGKVFLKFIVEADGSIGDIEVLQGIGFGCDEEAKRVVAEMPKWSPGKVNGVAVPTYFTMPINFRLE